MTWGEELHSAIERRDATTLRRMAEEARKEETRMFLNLLAGMVGATRSARPAAKKDRAADAFSAEVA